MSYATAKYLINKGKQRKSLLLRNCWERENAFFIFGDLHKKRIAPC
jgi:hypothetical protein